MNGPVVPFRQALDEALPAGFELRADGVYWRSAGERDGSGMQRLCSVLRVRGLVRDRRGAGWGRLLEVVDPDFRTHRVVLPGRALAGEGTEAVAILLDLGLQMSPGRAARAAFLQLLAAWTPSARFRTSDRSGWADETFKAFVLGCDQVTGAQDVVPLLDAGAAAGAFVARGSADEWRQGVAALCLGNPLAVLVVSHAFSGPLLEPLGLDGGGIHLRGASSTGKSTLLRTGTSVWGPPDRLNSWRATANGLEGVAAARNGTLCVLDEIGEAHAQSVAEVVYALANGVGKARASKTGAALPQLRWRVPILSSGEVALADKIAEAGGKAKAGQLVRLIDVPVGGDGRGAFVELHGTADAAAFSRRLSDATAAAHGSAGPAFVAALIEDLDALLEQVRATMTRFSQRAREQHKLHGEGQVTRVVERLALTAAAGELATSLGLTGWPPGTAEEAALYVLQRWLTARGGVHSEERRAAIVATRSYISMHWSARFEDLTVDPQTRERIPLHSGWRDDAWVYITVDCWGTIHAGADATEAARHLRAAGYLRVGERDRLKFRMPEQRCGRRPRVYAVSLTILEDGHD